MVPMSTITYLCSSSLAMGRYSLFGVQEGTSYRVRWTLTECTSLAAHQEQTRPTKLAAAHLSM